MIESDRFAAATASAGSSDPLMPFERLLTDVSSRFIGWPTERLDEGIHEGLRQIVETFGIDRSTLSKVDPDTGQFHSTHSWAAPGLTPVPATVSSRTYPWALARYRAGLPVVFSRLDELPREADLDRASYGALELRSHVGMPIMVDGEFVAVLGFGALRSEREWDENLIARMRLIADLFGSALVRKRAQERIEQVLRFERLLADLSVSLQMSPGEEVETTEPEALGMVARLLDADRAELWELAPASARLVASDRSGANGGSLRPPCPGLSDLPWFLHRVLAGQVVDSAAIDGPPAAEDDLAALRSAGAKSLLAIPLRGKDAVIGALTLTCVREERIWTDDVVPRLSVFGKLLLNAVALRESETQVALASAAADLLRRQLAHASRVSMLGQLASALAHELSQPLVGSPGTELEFAL